MKFIKRLLSMLRIVFKRMLTQPWLVAAKTLGLFVGMMMIFAIPLYADAINYRLFSGTTRSADEKSSYAPFSVLFMYSGSLRTPLDYEKIVEVSQYLTGGEYQGDIGLPVTRQVQYLRTNNYPLYPATAPSFNNDHIAYISLGTITDFENNITVTDGSLDQWNELPDGYIPVMIHEKKAQDTGIRVGEKFMVKISWRDENFDKSEALIPILVAGTYVQTNENSDFWYMGDSASMADRLIMSNANFTGTLAEATTQEVYSASWYLAFDHTKVHFNNSTALGKRVSDAALTAQKHLDGITLSVSPLESLKTFTKEANTLTLYLYIVCAPIIVLVMIFIGMVSKIEVESRLNEIAILRSRGATRRQIMFIEGAEALILGLIAALLATPASLGITYLLASTRSFLDFSLKTEGLRIAINAPMLYTAAIMILAAVITQVIPSMTASKHTVTSYKQQQARLIEKPWWQRFYLDIVLLLLVGFGMFLLRDIQANTEFFQTTSENSILFSLLYLLPILLSISVSLLFLRLLPYGLALLSWIVSKTNNVNFLMAVRSLHRMPNAYQMPLMLLIITVNLAVFTTTLANTVDRHLYDQVYYSIGSELRFTDYGENTTAARTGGSAATTGSWSFLPVETYLEAPGVVAVSRLGEYTALPAFSGEQSVAYFGIDRLGFAQTGFWRDDFSSEDLGSLMNQLALRSDGVLVSSTLQDRYNLQPGDLIPIKINAFGDEVITNVYMVGSFEYFPTWYPEQDGELMVGNLDYIFNSGAGPYPYTVMAQTDGKTNVQETIKYLNKQSAISWSTGGRASELIEEAQQEPMRQGFFGLLTISFFVTALLSFLGFFLYAVFSLRRRFIELGVLRAIGLSTRQMGATLAWEFISLIFSGAFIGTLLGMFSSRYFVPYMQIGAENFQKIPPYYILIAWNQIYEIYGLLFFLFLLLVIALVAFLRKINIFEAIKLGETV